MDKFVQFTDSSTPAPGSPSCSAQPGLVMDYYDGNTVTALWNYAQNYAMSDNNYDTNFGPSTPGALNLISGDDGGGYAVEPDHRRPPVSQRPGQRRLAGRQRRSAPSTATSTRPSTTAPTPATPRPARSA